MPLLPRVVGGVEIRERRQRYPGEPRYKRLDFVRSKTTTNTDEWDLVRTTQKRYITVPVQYNVPVFQYPQVGYQPQYQPQPQYQYGLQQEPHHGQQQQYPHHEHHHEQIPIPPQHHGQHQLPFREQRLLEPAPHHHGIHDIIGHDDGDDIMYEYIEPRPKVRMPSSNRHSSKSRSKSKKRRPRGDSIYSSDSSSDDDSYRSGRRHRDERPSRPRGRVGYDSDDNWASYNARYSRSRSRGPVMRGW